METRFVSRHLSSVSACRRVNTFEWITSYPFCGLDPCGTTLVHGGVNASTFPNHFYFLTTTPHYTQLFALNLFGFCFFTFHKGLLKIEPLHTTSVVFYRWINYNTFFLPLKRAFVFLKTIFYTSYSLSPTRFNDNNYY